MGLREELRETLFTDRKYRHAYADEILSLLLCTQIRVIREQQGKTQAQLADILHTTQTAISRIESTEYSAWNIRTLKKLARAFDLRLRITLEDFGTLWKDVSSLNRESLERAINIESDPEFARETVAHTPENQWEITATVEAGDTWKSQSPSLAASAAVGSASSVGSVVGVGVAISTDYFGIDSLWVRGDYGHIRAAGQLVSDDVILNALQKNQPALKRNVAA